MYINKFSSGKFFHPDENQLKFDYDQVIRRI